jgi:hypothetical protein
MRDEMAGDVAAERQLPARHVMSSSSASSVLALMPRSRGFRVSTDGNVSVYLASPQTALEAGPPSTVPIA